MPRVGGDDERREKTARALRPLGDLLRLVFAVGLAFLGGYLGYQLAGNLGAFLGGIAFCFIGIVIAFR